MTDCEPRLRDMARALGAQAGETIGVAVSGGGDSMAMLHLLVAAGWPVAAVTVDHGLRAEAKAEAELVRRACAGLSVPHTVLAWRRDRDGGNLQDQARRARHALIGDWARARGIGTVALGHTMDDQAETFLMRLARGSGIDGLSGMPARRVAAGVVWVRPFLGARRHELRAYLAARGIAWAEDASNADPDFDRVKARRALVELGPLGLDAEAIGVVARNLDQARMALDEAARAVVLESCREDRGDLVFDRAAFDGHPPEIARRIAVAGLRWVGGAEYPPRRQAQLSELLPWAMSGHPATMAGCLLTATGETRRITREYNAVRDLRGPVGELWDGRWRLEGPQAPDLAIQALGEAVAGCPWRGTGMPRAALMASPAIWRGAELVAAPVAGLEKGWTASATGRGKFADFLLSR